MCRSVGIWLGWTIINGWNPLTGFIQTVNALVAVFEDADNTRVILFSAIAGMALCDVLTARRIRYYRLFLETSSGDTRCYTTARAADAQRLIKRLAQKGIRTDIAAIQQS